MISSKFPRSLRVPQACRRKSIFLVDANNLKDVRDIQSDLNGVFRECHEVKHRAVTITKNNETFVLKAHAKKPAENDDHSQTMMHTHRTENEFGLIRHMWFTSNGKVLQDAVLLQYCINKVICGDVDEVIFTVQKHGNCKGDGRFYSTKKSTILDLKTKFLGLGKRKAS